MASASASPGKPRWTRSRPRGASRSKSEAHARGFPPIAARPNLRGLGVEGAPIPCSRMVLSNRVDHFCVAVCRCVHRSQGGYGATAARLTPDQKVGSSNLSGLIAFSKACASLLWRAPLAPLEGLMWWPVGPRHAASANLRCPSESVAHDRAFAWLRAFTRPRPYAQSHDHTWEVAGQRNQ